MFETIAVSSSDRPKICDDASEVLRVLVVRAQADVDADVVQQRGDLQQQPLAPERPWSSRQLVEQPHREHRDVAAVRAIEPVSCPTASALASTCCSKSAALEPAARLGEVEQHAGPQRRVGDDEPAGRVSDSSVAVDQQRRHQRLGLDGRQTEPIDQLLLVQPLDRVAERQERVARHLPHAVAGFALEDLRGGEAHVAADRDHVRDAAERNLEPDLVDDVRDRIASAAPAARRGVSRRRSSCWRSRTAPSA